MASLNDKHGTGVAYQIPRNSLALLMVSQVVVILPLVVHISPWIVGVTAMCGYWRTQVHRGRWGYPAGWVKTLMVVGSVAGIALSGYKSFALEAAASLLVLAFSLKLVEMKNRRDAYLVIYLSYFLIATAFLFDQTMALTAYEVLAAVVVTAAMVGMNQLQTRVRPVASLWVAVGLIFQALPLTLVLFLLFPRVAPLWSIPLPSAATTGISDRITPGDVANLTQSDELAFRVTFEGAPPAQRDLYWRGLVYSEFARGTWTIADPLDPLPAPAPQSNPAGVGYEVFLEPTQSKWLFTLDTPVSYADRFDLLADYRLVSEEPVLSVMRYQVVSDGRYLMDSELEPAIRERETQLWGDDNPRLRAYAAELYARTGSVEAMIDAMLTEIRQTDFAYTLSPPTLERINSIDQFWFDARRGFCTHYAGAMVYALRSVGIPARMVGGYQGGELNPVTGHLVVRQFDAHAWVEVWLADAGWTRYDPTAAVAPSRIESGLNTALSSEDRAALSFFANARMGEGGLVNGVLQFVDSMEFRWNLWVVGYDAATQADVLKGLLGKVTPARIGLALAAGGTLSLLLVAAAVLYRRRPRQRHPVERVFNGFCRSMARQGLPRDPDETPGAYVQRLANRAQVDVTSLLERLQRQLYDPDASADISARRQLKNELRKLRFRLAFTTAGEAS